MAPSVEFDWRRAAILRTLLYPVQFDSDPMTGIDRVLAREVFTGHSNLWPTDVAAAIDAGLGSDVKLSELIPLSHSEALIRRYLAALRERLDLDPGRHG